MTPNEGSIDRIVRSVIGIVLLALIFFTSGAVAWIVGIVGAVMLVTGLVGWCPAYALIGVKTCATGEKKTA